MIFPRWLAEAYKTKLILVNRNQAADSGLCGCRQEE
ncbi:hypothetical protein I9X38_04735 [Bacillus mojavensis]|nr:hypothetical protein I9X38_04735 [Bacillus mojavensis]